MSHHPGQAGACHATPLPDRRLRGDRRRGRGRGAGPRRGRSRGSAHRRRTRRCRPCARRPTGRPAGYLDVLGAHPGARRRRSPKLEARLPDLAQRRHRAASSRREPRGRCVHAVRVAARRARSTAATPSLRPAAASCLSGLNAAGRRVFSELDALGHRVARATFGSSGTRGRTGSVPSPTSTRPVATSTPSCTPPSTGATSCRPRRTAAAAAAPTTTVPRRPSIRPWPRGRRRRPNRLRCRPSPRPSTARRRRPTGTTTTRSSCARAPRESSGNYKAVQPGGSVHGRVPDPPVDVEQRRQPR